MKPESKKPVIDGEKNNVQNYSPSKSDEAEKIEKAAAEIVAAEKAAVKEKEHRKIKLAILNQEKTALKIKIQEKIAELNQASNVASQQETSLRHQESALKNARDGVVFKSGELKNMEDTLSSKEKQIGNC